MLIKMNLDFLKENVNSLSPGPATIILFFKLTFTTLI